jgi:hypothetical protein
MVRLVRLLGLRLGEVITLAGYPLEEVVHALTLHEATMPDRTRRSVAVEHPGRSARSVLTMSQGA